MKNATHFAGLSDFGHFLRNFRNKTKQTQKDLSVRIGVSQQTLLKWENRRTFPAKESVLKRLADILHIPFQEFLKIKQAHKLEHRQRLILRSKDPVVSAPGLNYVPIFNERTAALPLEAIRNPARWTGERHFLPAGLFPGHIFAFRAQDNFMNPYYRKDQVLLFDMRAEPKEGDIVLVKIKARPPLLRIYFREGSRAVFKRPAPRQGVLRAKENEIDWCYPVLEFEKKPPSFFRGLLPILLFFEICS